METLLVILIVTLLVLNAISFAMFLQARKESKDLEIGQNDQKDRGLQLLLQHINNLSRTVDQKIGESRKDVQESLRHQSTESQKIIRDVTERLTKLDETNRQVLSFSDQLRRLQDTLTNPKQRGILGEYYLEEILKNVLPPNSYKMQYGFKDGEIVDAVVFVKDKIIPIDSKFTLENYQKFLEATDDNQRKSHYKMFESDLKNRITETSKYIRPDEGTMEFAFMFIPSESIYYDLLVNKYGDIDLIEHAFKNKHVVVVSPTSFLAYLQTVLQGLKAMQIEESAKDIRKNVGVLQKHIDKYDEFMQKLGGHLGTTVNTYNHAYKEFKKIDKDVLRISGKGGGVEVLEIDKPNVED